MRKHWKFLVAVTLLQVLRLPLVNGQDFVVTTQGDTLKGKIKLFSIGPDKKVVIKGEKKTTIPILKTRSASIKGDTYQPVRSSGGYQFMKVIKPGYLTLYSYQAENQTGFDTQFLQKIDGSSLDVPNLGFKKMMTNFLSDCPSVSERIDDGELGKPDLHKIVDAYNECIQARTKPLSKGKTNQQEKPSMLVKNWKNFETKLAGAEKFEGKEEALEMIKEIQSKLRRSEKVPRFIIQGLQEKLSDTPFLQELTVLLNESQL